MRTKTTLLCAAALAAGVVGSYAQSNVYSLNIVGYVNQTLQNNYTFVSNPLQEDSLGNMATNVYPNPGVVGVGGGPLDGSALNFWNGVKWTVVLLDSSQVTGYTDGNGNPTNTPVIPQGMGLLFVNGTGAAVTNTYVGTVVQSNKITMPNNFSSIGSSIPLAGDVMSVLGLTNTVVAGSGVYDGAGLQTAKYNGAGQIVGYNTYTFDSSQNPGVAGGNGTGFDEGSSPSIALAQGFFFNNGVGNPVTWTQVLNP
jgi:hypothetical protein